MVGETVSHHRIIGVVKKTVLMATLLVVLMLAGCAPRKGPDTSPETFMAEDYALLIKRGQVSMRRGLHDKAVTLLNQAVRLRPSASEAHNLLGMAYFLQGEQRLAAQAFQVAVELKPDYAEAYSNMGSAYFMRGQEDKAKGLFLKALSLSPNLVSANYSLGTLLVNQGQLDEGNRYLSRGIALDPDFLERQRAFGNSLRSFSFGKSESLFAYARVYAAAGRSERAIDLLLNADQAGFRDWQRIYEHPEFEQIRQDRRIKRLVQSSLENYGLHLIQANALIKKGAYEQALGHIRKAIAIRPGDAKANNVLGMAYFLQARYREAAEAFRKAIDLDFSYAEAYSNLGNTYAMQKRTEAALGLFEKALSIYPNLISANYGLGTILISLGRTDEGTQYLSNVVALDPEFLEEKEAYGVKLPASSSVAAETYIALAKAFARQGNMDRALAYLEKASEEGLDVWPRIQQGMEFQEIRRDPRAQRYSKKFD